MPSKGKKTSILGTGATFRGKIKFSGSLEIYGKMYSNLNINKLTIAKGGFCEGDVTSLLSFISGEFKGKMKSESVWLTSNAKMHGQIHYNSLQMDRGAALNCRIIHNWDDEKKLNLIKNNKNK